MNKKIITVIGIIALVVIAGSFWFAKNNTKNTDISINPQVSEETKDDQTVIARSDNDEAISENENTSITYNEDGTIDTSNWQTYRNEEYGFEVKYPEDWGFSEVENGYMTVGGKMSECALVPDGCPVAVLHDRHKGFNSDYISIKIITEDLQNINRSVNKKSQWAVGMLGGCHIKASKILKNGKEFLFYSFYEATDLNDDEQTRIDAVVCESNDLNPLFDEILSSFTAIK